MSDQTAIEWADSTFNAWMGCTKISPACDHCYAEALMDTRLGRVQWGAGQPRLRTSAANWRKPVQWNNQPFVECPECGWRGEWREADARSGCCPSCGHLPRLFNPARRRVFCASLADVFDNEVDPQWRADLLELIWKTPNLDWMLLTKRVGNAAAMLEQAVLGASGGDHTWAHRHSRNLRHVWIGVTIASREEMLRDAPKLRDTPAAVRFWSVEPMLGDLGRIPADLMPDWVICGGESGPNARPMHPDWVRSLRDQCQAAGVPFLLKQWGEWHPIDQGGCDWYSHLYRSNVRAREGEDQNIIDEGYGRNCTVPTSCLRHEGGHVDPMDSLAFQQGTGSMLAFRVGKKAAGRMLDGRTWDQFPRATT